MKILFEKTEILRATKIDFDKAVDFDKAIVEGDMIILPVITTPTLSRDWGAVIDKAGYLNNIPWVDYEKTKFNLHIDLNSNDFICILNVDIFPYLFDAQEESEYLKIYSEDDSEVRELFKHFCKETSGFYNDPSWATKGHSENYFDIELENDEIVQIEWIIIQLLFNKAYYEPVNIVPVSA